MVLVRYTCAYRECDERFSLWFNNRVYRAMSGVNHNNLHSKYTDSRLRRKSWHAFAPVLADLGLGTHYHWKSRYKIQTANLNCAAKLGIAQVTGV